MIEIEINEKEGDSMEEIELQCCIVRTFRCSEQIARKVIESSKKRGELEAIKKMVSPINNEKAE